ncbi:HNH endonuclease domain protein [Pseudomonas amygdali pv. lachrymans]|nr:HNH endonuclease domain protein [Pseudomonas amygdali pv. lachrymans]
MTVGAMERVIAKIGINLLAYYLGCDYVTDPGFQQVKDSILTGTPRLSAGIIEDASIQSILDAAPENHHVFCLSKASQEGEQLSR